MLHPVLHLLATRPQWLAEHAEGYAQLATAELGDAAASGRRALVLGAATLCAMTVAATLSGVALLLAALLPAGAALPWLLWAVPAVPLAVALVLAFLLTRPAPAPVFGVLKEQLQADLALLREAGAQ